MDTPTTAAAQKVPAAKTGFLDLSAELKNKIYRLSLCADLEEGEYVDVELRETKHRCKGTALLRCPGYRCPFRTYTIDQPRSTRRSTTLHLTPNILRTCKQIYAEATSILYGENAFRMDFHTLDKVIDVCPNFSQARSIQLGFFEDDELGYLTSEPFVPWMNPAAGALAAIEKMPKLRNLLIEGDVDSMTLDGEEWTSPTSSREWPIEKAQILAKNLQSAVTSLVKSGRKVRDVLTLSIEVSPTYRGMVGDYGEDVGKVIGDFENDIEQMVELVYEELEADLGDQ